MSVPPSPPSSAAAPAEDASSLAATEEARFSALDAAERARLAAEKLEDPLEAARKLRERRERELEAAASVRADEDPALYEFYRAMRSVDQENELARILGSFRLNPYEVLGVPLDCDAGAARKAYRKASLAVHPDKCTLEGAPKAFEMLGDALHILEDPDAKARIDTLLAHARDETIAAWKKAVKGDAAAAAAARVAVALHRADGANAGDGSSGPSPGPGAASSDASASDAAAGAPTASRLSTAQQLYVSSDAFREAWKLKSREVLARYEWRRRSLAKRLAEEAKRAKKEHVEERRRGAARAEQKRKWEKDREQRVGSWRSFVKGGVDAKGKKGDKAKRSAAAQGVRAPKLLVRDSDKDYITRPRGEGE